MKSWTIKRVLVLVLALIAIILFFKWVNVSEKLSATQSALGIQLQMQNLLYGIIGRECIRDHIIESYAREEGMQFLVKKASEVSFPTHIDPREVSKVIVLGIGEDVDWAKSEGIHLYYSVEGCLLNGV